MINNVTLFSVQSEFLIFVRNCGPGSLTVETEYTQSNCSVFNGVALAVCNQEQVLALQTNSTVASYIAPQSHKYWCYFRLMIFFFISVALLEVSCPYLSK